MIVHKIYDLGNPEVQDEALTRYYEKTTFSPEKPFPMKAKITEIYKCELAGLVNLPKKVTAKLEQSPSMMDAILLPGFLIVAMSLAVFGYFMSNALALSIPIWAVVSYWFLVAAVFLTYVFGLFFPTDAAQIPFTEKANLAREQAFTKWLRERYVLDDSQSLDQFRWQFSNFYLGKEKYAYTEQGEHVSYVIKVSKVSDRPDVSAVFMRDIDFEPELERRTKHNPFIEKEPEIEYLTEVVKFRENKVGSMIPEKAKYRTSYFRSKKTKNGRVVA